MSANRTHKVTTLGARHPTGVWAMRDARNRQHHVLCVVSKLPRLRGRRHVFWRVCKPFGFLFLNSWYRLGQHRQQFLERDDRPLRPISCAGGCNVCRSIQRARVERSATDLANPFFRTDSITSTAFKWVSQAPLASAVPSKSTLSLSLKHSRTPALRGALADAA